MDDYARSAETARRKLLNGINRAMLPVLGITFLLLIGAATVAFLLIAASRSIGQWGPILGIHLVQIAVGMVLGILCLFLGSAMCWYGITGQLSIGAETEKAKVNIQSAHIGVVLLVGGIALISVALHKSITATEVDRSPRPGATLDGKSGASGQLEDASKKIDLIYESVRTIAAANPSDSKTNRAGSSGDSKAMAQATVEEIEATEKAAYRRAADTAKAAASTLSNPIERKGADVVVEAVKELAKDH